MNWPVPWEMNDMLESHSTDRRSFLKASAPAAAATLRGALSLPSRRSRLGEWNCRSSPMSRGTKRTLPVLWHRFAM